jgi:UDP-2,3-diacylglucosamine pyrophosphatase LpxH
MAELTIEAVWDAYRKGGNFAEAARILTNQGFKMGRDSVRRRLFPKAGADAPAAEAAPVPEEIDVEDLIAERARKFAKKKKHFEATRVFDIKVNVDGPIGIGLFGDLHIDDDGTDVALAFEHAKVFDGSQEGLFAANLGDLWNNWIGSLKRLWAHQGTSETEALVLLKTWLEKINWMFFIKGNHDGWSGVQDPMDAILKGRSLVTRGTRARIRLHFPNGRVVEIYASHDFKGRSMYSTSFGPAKKAQFHRQADLYVCGHLHDSSYQHGFHPDGRMWHAMRVASYKTLDKYVEELDIEPNVEGYVCPVALIDPYADKPFNLIRWEFDPAEGARRLAAMRAEFKSKQKAA